jgi:hypothetical protein
MGPDEWPRFEELDRHAQHSQDGRPATFDELLARAPSCGRIAPEKLAKRHARRWRRRRLMPR